LTFNQAYVNIVSMSNPNIKRNIRNLSAVALATIAGGVAVKEVVLSPSSTPKPVRAPLIKRAESSSTETVPTVTVNSTSGDASPSVKVYRLSETDDDSTNALFAGVKPGKSSDYIESTSFKLTDPKDVPAGVSIEKNRIVTTHQGGFAAAQFTDPSNPNQPKGEIDVTVSATESDGASTTAHEEVPYGPPPAFPH